MKRNPPKKTEVLLTFALLSGLVLFLTGLAWSDDGRKPAVDEPSPRAEIPEPLADGIVIDAKGNRLRLTGPVKWRLKCPVTRPPAAGRSP